MTLEQTGVAPLGVTQPGEELREEVGSELCGALWGRWVLKGSSGLWAEGELRRILYFWKETERQKSGLKTEVKEPLKQCRFKLLGRQQLLAKLCMRGLPLAKAWTGTSSPQSVV